MNVLVIGAGFFGISAALELSKTPQNATTAAYISDTTILEVLQPPFRAWMATIHLRKPLKNASPRILKIIIW